MTDKSKRFCSVISSKLTICVFSIPFVNNERFYAGLNYIET